MLKITHALGNYQLTWHKKKKQEKPCGFKEILKEIKKYIKLNNNENTIGQTRKTQLMQFLEGNLYL